MKRRKFLLKDPIRERHLFQRRTILIGVLATLALVILALRMAYLQVVYHQHYSTLSNKNRVSIQAVAPTRGLIFDRNGVILAQNIPTFTLEIIQERVPSLEHTLDELTQLIHITDEDLERFEHERRRTRRFNPVPLRFRLTDEEVALVAVNQHRLPGVEINATLTRHYPMGDLTAHTVGYVGRISEQDLRHIDTTNYAATRHIGKIGVERSHEQMLHGRVGYVEVETNARGRVIRVLNRTPSEPGVNLHLSIDVALQQAAKAAFTGERGALVAIEPHTGEVLALVSIPSYDPNLFVNGIPVSIFRELNDSRDQPLFNRALRGQYPPGSTTKPMLGLGGLEMNEITAADTVFCPGWFSLPGDDHRYRDWLRRGHGTIGVSRALIESCDVFFYDLALKLGIDRMSSYMAHFGFGQRTGLDIGGEASGLLPSREWKRRARREPWFPGETLITGIGQGFNLVTPLQLANATATLANQGKLLKPHVVRSIEDPNTGEQQITETVIVHQMPITDPMNWSRIDRAMVRTVHEPNGTAFGISRGIQYRMAGKTGTAQVFGLGQDEEYVEEEVYSRLRDHALFNAYAPADDPRIALALIVENGGSGGRVAAPIARRVIDRFLLGPVEEKHAAQ